MTETPGELLQQAQNHFAAAPGHVDQIVLGQKCLERAAELAPESWEVLRELGHGYLYTSRTKEAVAALEKAQVLYAPSVDAQIESLLEVARLEEDIAPPGQEGRKPIARYPRRPEDYADVSALIKRDILGGFKDFKPIINKSTGIFTFGSCFAVNIATTLKMRGYNAEHINYAEDLNSTFENVALLDWVAHGPSQKTWRFEDAYGPGFRANVKALIENAGVVILSLGVAPCFFDKTTGEFASCLAHFNQSNIHRLLRDPKYEFRTTTVAENTANLWAIKSLLFEMNPGASLVVTVSPVPLKATFEFDSAFIADCASKSTLRAAANEFMAAHTADSASDSYWPSFEIVRWLGGHLPTAMYGEDDGSALHPNQAVINTIIDAFVEIYCE